MSRPVRVLVGCLAVGAAVPAVVIAGFEGSETFEVNTSTYTAGGAQTTNSKQFQPIDELELSPVGIGAVYTLSAEMAEGRAKFRFVSEDFDPQPVPTPTAGVTFAAPGANAFEFYQRDVCANYGVEWKRAGRDPATASQVAVSAIGDASAC